MTTLTPLEDEYISRETILGEPSLQLEFIHRHMWTQGLNDDLNIKYVTHKPSLKKHLIN